MLLLVLEMGETIHNLIPSFIKKVFDKNQDNYLKFIWTSVILSFKNYSIIAILSFSNDLIGLCGFVFPGFIALSSAKNCKFFVFEKQSKSFIKAWNKIDLYEAFVTPVKNTCICILLLSKRFFPIFYRVLKYYLNYMFSISRYDIGCDTSVEEETPS